MLKNGIIEEKPSFRKVAARAGKLAACLILGAALLPQSARSAITYSNAVLSLTPVAFWQLNETNDPSSGTVAAKDSSGNGHNATYGTTSQDAFNGAFGPQPPTYLGFATNSGALACTASDANSPVTVPALNLNTNNVTITMWIDPSAAQTTFTGLFMNRDSISDAAGLGFGGTVDGTGMAELGYTWNTNNQATWSFNSGLYPVAGTWNFAALVITPTSATIYLYYIDPGTGQPHFASAVNAIAHTPEAFASGTTVLGADVANGTGPDGTRVFAGYIADAAVYRSALTEDQLLSLFAAGVGVTGFVPAISGQPVSQYALANSNVKFTASGINGASPLVYQWQLNGTNVNLLADSANFSGGNSNVLTIASATTSDVGTYNLVITNSVGSTVSSNATLTIQAPALVGEWLDGSIPGTNLLDVSGYSLAANHGGYYIGGASYVFTNDVPFGKTGQSILFYNGDTGIAISNSSTWDLTSDDTFDNRINNAFTIAFWAKGLPAAWNPWVSKYGENGLGWQLRDDGRSTSYSAFTVRDNNAGTNIFGTGGDDMGTRSVPTSDGNWHLYVGTYNASTGVRNLYIDGPVLAATEGSNMLYNLASAEHLCIGARDATPGNSFGNYFIGQIYDVRVYNYELASNAIQQLYGVATPASINVQPQDTSVINQESTRIIATAAGTLPISYQWQLNGTNINLLADSANFVGANSNILTIVSATPADAGSYHLVVNNSYGSAVTSSNALLTVVPRYLVGAWFNGSSSLADVSGFRPAGTHDGYAVNGTNYGFSSDVPPGRIGVSLYLNASDTAIAISNSSTLDANYTNTFDDTVGNAMTVACWAKGWPAGWSPFMSKNGDSGSPNSGWDLRNDGNNNVSPCWTIRGTGGTVVLGTAVYGNPEDMAATSLTYGNDGNWHAYVGTFNAGTGIRNLYVDGKLVASEIGNAKYALPSAEHLVIGGIDHSPGNTFVSFFTGKIFDVRVSNYDWNTNEVAVYSQEPDPVINGQPPQSITGYIGLSTKITVAGISGTLPITNQWQFDGTNVTDGSLGGATISGSSSNVLNIANLTTNVQGTFHLIVSNSKGVLVSSNAILTVLPTVAPDPTSVVGAWITGAANLADSSGYSPAGTHDGYGASGAGVPSSNYSFTNDVPAGMGGNSLVLVGNTAIAISNSSTLDAGYTNTYDDPLTNMTITFWAKGLPGGWNPWVCKYGENGQGWDYRVGNPGNEVCWTVRDNSSGSYTLGSGPVWAPTGDQDDMHSAITVDATSWHFYAGTFDGTAGIRNLYIDGVLQAQEIGNVPYNLAAASHLAIGGRDNGGNSFGNYFAGQIYNVRLYNTVLDAAEINHGMLKTTTAPGLPVPVLQGHNLVLSWSSGTLQQATNLLGPWTPTGATSPYTNDVTTAPRMYFRLSNP